MIRKMKKHVVTLFVVLLMMMSQSANSMVMTKVIALLGVKLSYDINTAHSWKDKMKKSRLDHYFAPGNIYPPDDKRERALYIGKTLGRVNPIGHFRRNQGGKSDISFMVSQKAEVEKIQALVNKLGIGSTVKVYVFFYSSGGR